MERHKGRLHSELTKARIRRKLSTFDTLKTHVENGIEEGSGESDLPYPRWIRINTLKTTLEDQLETTFTGFEQVTSVNSVRQRGHKRLYIDGNVPNLLAISPNIDLSKSDAYKSGHIIFQDKASCFPAYLLDPQSTNGDIVDACSAPGNKTTHLAAILLGHQQFTDECSQSIHAFEKSNVRADTLKKMVNIAGSSVWTNFYPGQDFLKTDPCSLAYNAVGALLLDPSCSGSGIVGRDEMPVLHLPILQIKESKSSKGSKKTTTEAVRANNTGKRKREGDAQEAMVDDDGTVTTLDSYEQVRARLAALSSFQLDLLLHAFKFTAARKIVYSTCSIHAEENEMVVCKALASDVARTRGWRILKRNEQIRGLRDWPIRGDLGACNQDTTLAAACIRTIKGDSRGTMGFFVVGFVRDEQVPEDVDSLLMTDERGHLIRDMLGVPVIKQPAASEVEDEGEEWNGFEDKQIEPTTSSTECSDVIKGTSKDSFKRPKKKRK